MDFDYTWSDRGYCVSFVVYSIYGKMYQRTNRRAFLLTKKEIMSVWGGKYEKTIIQRTVDR